MVDLLLDSPAVEEHLEVHIGLVGQVHSLRLEVPGNLLLVLDYYMEDDSLAEVVVVGDSLVDYLYIVVGQALQEVLY